MYHLPTCIRAVRAGLGQSTEWLADCQSWTISQWRPFNGCASIKERGHYFFSLQGQSVTSTWSQLGRGPWTRPLGPWAGALGDHLKVHSNPLGTASISDHQPEKPLMSWNLDKKPWWGSQHADKVILKPSRQKWGKRWGTAWAWLGWRPHAIVDECQRPRRQHSRGPWP